MAKSSQEANIWQEDCAASDEDESRSADGAGRVEHRSAVDRVGRSPADTGAGSTRMVGKKNKEAIAATVTASFPSRDGMPFVVLVRPILSVYMK